jgi:Uma2 family endonuclease
MMGVALQLDRALPNLVCASFTIGSLEAGWVALPDLAGIWKPLVNDTRDDNVIMNPWILVEVTSDASERIDRGPKLARYRSHPSVEVVVLVALRRRHVAVHRRRGGGWRVTDATTGALEIPSARLDVDALYNDPWFAE